MIERELDKFCRMLGIRIVPDQPIDETIVRLKGYIKWFFNEKNIPEQCQELNRDFEKGFLDGKSKEEQKDALLDRLIHLRYAYCIENAVSIIEKKRSGFGDNVVHIKKIDEEVEEFKKILDAYYAAYIGKVKSAEEVLKSPMDKFMKKQEHSGQMATKIPEYLTQKDLYQQQKRNQEKSDPQFKNFTGAPYRWGASLRKIETEEDLKSLCWLNESNEKNEQIIVMRLGEFQYDKFWEGASVSHPAGKYGQMRNRRYFWCDKIR